MAVIICTMICLVIPLMVIEIVSNFSLLTVKNISWVLTSFWIISPGLIPRSEITGSHGLIFESFLIDNAKLLSWKLIHLTSSRIEKKYRFKKNMLALLSWGWWSTDCGNILLCALLPNCHPVTQLTSSCCRKDGGHGYCSPQMGSLHDLINVPERSLATALCLMCWMRQTISSILSFPPFSMFSCFCVSLAGSLRARWLLQSSLSILKGQFHWCP